MIIIIYLYNMNLQVTSENQFNGWIETYLQPPITINSVFINLLYYVQKLLCLLFDQSYDSSTEIRRFLGNCASATDILNEVSQVSPLITSGLLLLFLYTFDRPLSNTSISYIINLSRDVLQYDRIYRWIIYMYIYICKNYFAILFNVIFRILIYQKFTHSIFSL